MQPVDRPPPIRCRWIPWLLAAAVALSLAAAFVWWFVSWVLSGKDHEASVFIPGFCVGNDGRIIYVAPGRGGSDLFLYDRTSHTRRRIAETRYLEAEPAFSPDGKHVVCTFLDPGDLSSGLELIDIATGRIRLLCESWLSGYAGYQNPTFSPDGSHVAFCHWGGGLNAPLLSIARQYLTEVNVKTGVADELTRGNEYYSIEMPLYHDSAHIVFVGDSRMDDFGKGQRVLAIFRRGMTFQNVVLPENCWTQLFGYSSVKRVYFALMQTSGMEDNHVTIIPEYSVKTEKEWRILPVRCSIAKYAAATNEVLFLSEDRHAYSINRMSLANGKVKTVLIYHR